MINFIKYFLWQRKKKQRVTYPKGYKVIYMPNSISSDMFGAVLALQKKLKDDKGIYYTADECYNLFKAYNNDFNKIRGVVN